MKFVFIALSIVLAWSGTSLGGLPIHSSISYVEIDGDSTLLNDQEPGIVFQGRVLNGCDGVPNVQIFQSFAVYEGNIIATTDNNGYYKSEFIYAPSDETVGVWAELEGYTFEPQNYFWRHYTRPGTSVYTLNFTASGKTPSSDCYFLPVTMKAEN